MNGDDIQKLRKFTAKSETDKAFSTLHGILTGIEIDKVINIREIHELKKWCSTYYEFVHRHPYNEVIPRILEFTEDNQLDPEEYEDLLWLASSIVAKPKYYDVITRDIQILEGIMHGILADNIINNAEVLELESWLNTNKQLQGTFPYDELFMLLEEILKDKIITREETLSLRAFFNEFINRADSVRINTEDYQQNKNEMSIKGICEYKPNIVIDRRLFSFTGTSVRARRREIADIIEARSGRFKDSITDDTDFLIVGNGGNPCWAYACYGRKIEKAIEMRKEGFDISIVNESDFWAVV